MKHKIYIFIGLLVLMLSFGSFERVLACSVSSYVPSFCEKMGRSDVVFIGKAVGAKKQKVTEENGVKTVWNGGEIYFEVQKGFVGLKKGTRVTVRSGNEDGYCGTWFEHNKSYLVFGTGNQKKDFSLYSATLSSSANEEVEALKNLPKVGTGSKVSGSIMQNAKSSLFADSIQPMSGTKIKIRQLQGKQKTYEVSANADGNYEITRVPAGKYEILPVLSEKMEFQSSKVEVNDRGCVISDFLIKNKTKISGRVIDAEGLPVKEIFVELLPYDLSEKPKPFTFREKELTEDDGSFTLESVPPGNYILSINYTTSPDEDDAFPTTFYPSVSDKSQAFIFTVEMGSSDIENVEFKLPPRLEFIELKGIVVFSDGTPVFDAHVGLLNAEDNLYTSDMRTDESGEFVLKGFQGREYYISADNYSYDKPADSVFYASSEKFILDENVKSFRLVLEKKDE